MPPTRSTRRPKATPKTLTIGIFGVGEAPRKSIGALLDDYIADDVEPSFILAATKDHLTTSVQAVVDYANENEIPYEVITDDTTAKSRALKGIAKEATKEHKATDAGVAIVNLLKDAEDGRLVVLWDDKLSETEDGGAYEAVFYADEHDVPCFDLCNGLEPMNFDSDDDTDAADPVEDDEDDDDDEQEEEKVTSIRGKKSAQVSNEADPRLAGLPTYKEATKLGIRALRTMARERELASSRVIGGSSPAEVLAMLYPDGADTATTAPVQGTLEEEIATASHAVNNGSSATAAGNGKASAGDALIEMIARAVAERVKELVDA